ncbi:hypothetical protein ACM41_16760 [Bradyrhizobium sp. CCBAU 21362]|nr:hypothetical protein [Bradyrhizobium sp. CCBAU 21362]
MTGILAILLRDHTSQTRAPAANCKTLDGPQRADGDVGPAQSAEIQQHALGILQLKRRLTGAVIDLFDPERRGDGLSDAIWTTGLRNPFSFEERDIGNPSSDIWSGSWNGHIGSNRRQSWLRKSGQDDKWSFCLTAGKIVPRIRRDDEQTR